MKVFDFTNGRKGEELDDIKIANSLEGWLVRKGDKVYKVELNDGIQRSFGADADVSWHSGATWLRWANGEPIEDVRILPEDFEVAAICFCTGRWSAGENSRWNWVVIGTAEWNKQACKDGVLKATYLRTVTDDTA